MKLQYTRDLNLSPEVNEQLRRAFQTQDYFDVVTTVPTTSTLKKGQIQFYSDGTDLWIYTSDGTTVKSQKFGISEGLVGDYTVDDTGVSDGMVLYYDSASGTIKFKTISIPTQVTQVNNSGSNVAFSETAPGSTIASVTKTCTSGKTIFVIATGYVTTSNHGVINCNLYRDSSVNLGGGVTISTDSSSTSMGYAMNTIVTGLSGSVTFYIQIQGSTGPARGNAWGNITVLEF